MPSKPNCPSQTGSGNNSPSDFDIRQQLEKILASPEFQSSPMLHDFLRFVVEKTLSGRDQEIKGYTVATEVMGRQADFDGAKDTIVRIQAGRLRRALERYYVTLGGQDPIRIDIPKGAKVPTFHPADRAEAGVDASTPTLNEAVLTIPSGPSVAMLPFLNLTGGREQEFFAEAWPKKSSTNWPVTRNCGLSPFNPRFAGKARTLTPGKWAGTLTSEFFLDGKAFDYGTLSGVDQGQPRHRETRFG